MTDSALDTVETFRIEETYYFRQYFDESAFDLLKQFYDPEGHRFAVPVQAFQRVAAELRDCGYALNIHRDLRPFTVALQRYSTHPEVIFSEKVYEWRQDDYHMFLLRTREAVEIALHRTALPLDECPVDPPSSITPPDPSPKPTP